MYLVHPKLFFPTFYAVRTRGTCRDKFFTRLSLSIRPRNLAANSTDANHDRSLRLSPHESVGSFSHTRVFRSFLIYQASSVFGYRRNTVCTLKGTLSILIPARHDLRAEIIRGYVSPRDTLIQLNRPRYTLNIYIYI